MVEYGRGGEQQEYQQILIQEEVLKEHYTGTHDEQSRKRERDSRMDAADPHQVIKQTADRRAEDEVNNMKHGAVMYRKKLEHDSDVKIESRRLGVKVEQAFDEPVFEQLGVDDLEESRERAQVESHTQRVVDGAGRREQKQQE